MGICEGNQVNKTTEESKTKEKSDKGDQIPLENPNEVIKVKELYTGHKPISVKVSIQLMNQYAKLLL